MIPPASLLYAKRRALSCIDSPYKMGAKWSVIDEPSPDKPIDCSGLSKWILAQAGVILPDGAHYQHDTCVKRDGGPQLLDLGFADLCPDGWIDHVVVCLGDGRVIEARGNPYNKVITRPVEKWDAQKGFLGWFIAPGLR